MKMLNKKLRRIMMLIINSRGGSIFQNRYSNCLETRAMLSSLIKELVNCLLSGNKERGRKSYRGWRNLMIG